VECVPVADVDVWDSAVPQRYVNTGFVPSAPWQRDFRAARYGPAGGFFHRNGDELSALYCGFPPPNIRVGYQSVQRAPGSLFVARTVEMEGANNVRDRIEG
jgi:hypothetical protein